MNIQRKKILTISDLFKLIKHSDYTKVGKDVDYNIYVMQEEKKIYLLFFGSNSLMDWRINFNFFSKVYKNQKSCLKIHRGFIKAWKSANDVIMGELIKLVNEHPDYRVVIAGWSYGGAISILASEDFYFRTLKKPILITFGSPKIVPNKKSKDYLLSCCHSVRQFNQDNDLITKLVPFYRHIKEIGCGENFSLFKLFNVKKYHTTYHKIGL